MAKSTLTMSERIGDIGIIRFQTSQILDGMNVQQLGEELLETVDKHYIVKVVINFEKVKYLSSAVLGKLIALNKRIMKEKGRLALCCLNKDIEQVFHITRLDKVIPIFGTEEEALQRIESIHWPKK